MDSLSPRLLGQPSFVGQALSLDLGPFEHPQVNMVPYVDSTLLWAPPEDTAQEGTGAFLTFLAGRRYKASKAKARLCHKEGRDLGLNLSKGRRALGEGRRTPILVSLSPNPET